MTAHGWRKSRYSGNGHSCVEVATADHAVLVRDCKDHGLGPVIGFTPEQWIAFLADADTAAVSIHRVGGETHLRAADGVTLRFTAGEWTAFRAGVADGEFDLRTPA